MTIDAPTSKKNKGKVLKGYSNYIKKKWGADGWEECRKAAGIQENEFFEEKWYPHKIGADMAVWIGEQHGMKECRTLGTYIATQKGVVSYFAWMAGLNKVLDRFMIEIRDNANYGEARLERGDNKTATVYFKGVCSSEAGCQVWLGVLEGVFKLTKTKGTVEKLQCEHKGDGNCVYKMDWR